jgi:hypothetical protein
MTDWSEGYFSDLNYLHGYYRGMNPLWMRFICLLTGVEPPEPERCAYLELGFGRGLSLAIHAAANDGKFWGTDINAGHVAEALEMDRVTQSGATILDESFRQLSSRRDLPQFDFICLHGVWSWVSDENRSAIVDILSTRLRPGGVVYVSYNCLPGWSPMAPIRELMALHHRLSGRMVDPGVAIENSMAFAAKVLNVQLGHADANPDAARFVKALESGGTSREYIAHEYLNRDWHVPTFAQFLSDMERAKLGFVGHSQPLGNFDKLRLSPEARAIVDGIAHQPLRETVRDYMLNTRFRCDVLVKGMRLIPAGEYRKRWHSEHFVLVADRQDFPEKLQTLAGAVTVDGVKSSQVIDVLRHDGFRPKTVLEMLERVPNIGLAELMDMLVLFVDSGFASPARIPSRTEIERCRRINRHILDRAQASDEIQYLASPVTGGAISISHQSLLFLFAWERGKRSASDLAAYAAEVLQDDRRDGGEETPANDRMDLIRIAAGKFLAQSMPVLQALIVL